MQLDEMRHCVRQIDDVLTVSAGREDSFNRYIELNDRFHLLLKQLSGSAIIARQVERAVMLPFASPSGFLLAQATDPVALKSLIIANDQHHQVVEAIELRQGERADAIVREHARLAHRNLQSVLRDQQGMKDIPGSTLIRRRA
jgi:GntR family transcriptional regulator of vanillate catabolism